MLLVGLVAWTLAYQWPYTFQLAIGGDSITHRREDDRPFLQPAGQPYRENASFNASQPQPPKGASTNWWELPEQPYRWTTANATMAFPGIGGGPWLVAVRASGPPTRQPTLSRWSDGATTQAVAIAPERARVYRFLARPDQLGNLTLQFQTEPYATPNDPRSLGFRMHGITLRPAGFQWPSWAQLGWLAGALALCYGLARRLGLPQRWVGACGLALVVVLALLLAEWRMWLTIFTPALLPLLAGCYVLAVVLLQIAPGVEPRTGEPENQEPKNQSQGDRETGRPVFLRVPQRSEFLRVPRFHDALPSAHPLTRSLAHPLTVSRGIVLLIVLAFALRLGGMLHPHTIFSDIGLNSNNIEEFTVGNVYFTEGLPAEAGGGDAPYPPGQFIVLAPGQLLVPTNDEGRKLLIKIGNALLDSLVVGLLWYMLRRAGAGERAALFGAALYIAPTPLLNSFSIGEFANVFGQGLAMPVLALLALTSPPAPLRIRRGESRQRRGEVQTPRRGVSADAGEHVGSGGEHVGSGGEHVGSPLRGRGRWVFGLALLGIALLGHLGVAISLATMLASLAVLWLFTAQARRSFVPLVVVGIIAVAFVALFYYSAFAELLSERFAGSTQSASNALSIGEKIARQGHVLVISPLMLGLGALGALLAGRSGRDVWLRLLLGAWWLGTLLSFGLLLFANQAVRWQHFLYPALCLGGGLLLGALWRRGHAARLVVLGVLLFIVGQSVTLWIEQLIAYLH